ncbi:unnamed protein product [Pipistrellus nathusii]|uniref:Frizzled-10 n=1 Tax=Pipistrellus nathusii TaxID=59473 RepID=A0ABN9ZNT5_PIPNA
MAPRPGPRLWLALQLLGACAALRALDPARPGEDGRCQPIEIPLCRGIGYNLTRLPNLLGHAAQREAALRLHELAPLVELGCHAHLRFVLCSLFAPMCAEQVSAPIPACRPMCEAARRRCAPVLERFRFRWPDALDCGRLPTKNDPNFLCMEAPGDGSDEPGAGPRGGSGPFPPPARPPQPRPPAGDAPEEEPPPQEAGVPAPGRPAACANPGKFLRVGRGAACAPRCAPGVDVLWSREDKRVAAVWLAVWAALCFASSAFTALTFLADPARFRYPERPIAFLAVCSGASSLGYLARLLAGAESIACGRDGGGRRFVVQAGPEGAGCALVFLALYYFGMAGAAWWVVLTLAWFLAAGRQWGREAIEALSGYFHLAAWAVPAAQAGLALALRRVAGDELTGVCYVGGLDAPALTGLVLAPLGCCLALGTAFLLWGFAALFRIRRAVRSGGGSTRKLERLMARIGLFALLHTLPAAGVLGCLLYERRHAERWRALAAQRACRLDARTRRPDCRLAASIPALEVFLLKTAMGLLAGVTSGVWVWTAKTLRSWRGVCGRRLRGPGRGKPPAQALALAHGGGHGPGAGIYKKAQQQHPQKAHPGKCELPAQPPACV